MNSNNPTQDHHLPAPGFKPLERKRSMSKPTDLDELIRLQEEEERRLRDRVGKELWNEHQM